MMQEMRKTTILSLVIVRVIITVSMLSYMHPEASVKFL